MTSHIPVYLARTGNAVLRLAGGDTLNLTRHAAIQLAIDLAELNGLRVVTRDEAGDKSVHKASQVTGHTDDCIPALGPDFCVGHE